jgi:hypothetical protein
MTKITNTASGARGVRTDQGLVMVEPGQTVDVELAKNEELYEGLAEGAGGIDSMKKADLIAICDAEGIAHDDSDSRADLIAKIEAARAAK